MYSVEDSYSFERLKDEVENAKKFVDPDQFVWVLVGHKSDLSSEISADSISAWATQLDTKLNFYASSKTGENVVQLFDRVVSHIHRVRRGRPIHHYSQSDGPAHALPSKPQITTSGKENPGSNTVCPC